MTHPGTILFVDEHGVSKPRPIAEIPDEIAFATIGGKRIPVVRVVSHLRGDQRVIRCYGADGALLTSTVQAPPPG